MGPLARNLREVSLDDINQVGGKAASLGEMLQNLAALDMRIPEGFVVTADAYRAILRANNLETTITQHLHAIEQGANLSEHAQKIRNALMHASLPDELQSAIVAQYKLLEQYYHQQNLAVAVRSSATAEDLPNASFAGQQDSYLNISGPQQLLETYRKTVASLFTDRALIYRQEHKIPSESVAIAVCVQKMVRSDRACAGVMFTLDPESGFPDIVTINAAYGLGELVVQGTVTPDEYVVYKQALAHNVRPIIQRQIGTAAVKLVLDDTGTPRQVPLSAHDQTQFVLSTDEIHELAALGVRLEQYYTKRKGSWCPLDIEWAKDGTDGLLYIVQARPETVYSARQKTLELTHYRMVSPPEQHSLLATGQSIGRKIVTGTAHLVPTYDARMLEKFAPGDILVTRMTDPDWVPVLRKAAAVITDFGGRTCHAAIVSRELGIPAVIATERGTQVIAHGQPITVDCSTGSEGYVYDGTLTFTHDTLSLKSIPPTPCKLLVNVGQPETAYATAQLPVDGVGLARLEFIIAQSIGVHPLALLYLDKVADPAERAQIAQRTAPYASPSTYFVEKLAQGIGTIAAAFYPRPVIVRLTDLKSNEYRHLLGGAAFEPEEENPMLGWRGASRYSSPEYAPAFALECAAINQVRTTMGFTNVQVMVPFVRSVEEAHTVTQLLTQHKLAQHAQGLLWYMMVELPVNVILLEQFAAIFDGFSIGSNDLTQLTLGIDRDSSKLYAAFDERNPAVMALIHEALKKSQAAHRPIGICGEAPSHYPEFADFLIREGIDSISLSPDAIIPFLLRLAQQKH